jgi:hypothetical protein
VSTVDPVVRGVIAVMLAAWFAQSVISTLFVVGLHKMAADPVKGWRWNAAVECLFFAYVTVTGQFGFWLLSAGRWSAAGRFWMLRRLRGGQPALPRPLLTAVSFGWWTLPGVVLVAVMFAAPLGVDPLLGIGVSPAWCLTILAGVWLLGGVLLGGLVWACRVIAGDAAAWADTVSGNPVDGGRTHACPTCRCSGPARAEQPTPHSARAGAP